MLEPVGTELLGNEDIAPEMARLLSAHGVPTVDATDTQLFERMITDGMDGPFFLADLGAVESQYRLWQAHLPRVKPHYAVKCNPDALLLSTPVCRRPWQPLASPTAAALTYPHSRSLRRRKASC